MAKRITIINFKGGVGKTTLAFHLATGLVRYHEKKVLLIDMDHQSSLSLLCLDIAVWEKMSADGRTVNQIFSPFITENTPYPDDSIIKKNAIHPIRWIEDNLYQNLDLLPSSFALDDTEIKLTSTYKGDSTEWDKRTLMCRWLDETDIDKKYDYIIFDCAPATKIISQNALAASHGYIVPVVPERMMSQGVEHLKGMIESGIDARHKELCSNNSSKHRSSYVPDTPLIALAITEIQVASSSSGYVNVHGDGLSTLQQDWGSALMEPYIERGVGMLKVPELQRPVYDLGHISTVKNKMFPEKYKELTANLKSEIDKI